jgi:adenosylhomocysteine nucleosidase
MKKLIVLCAIPDEVEGLHYTDVFFTGVGKINAAATTEQIIRYYKPNLIINYGTAGSLDTNIKGLVKVTGFVDRDMDARPLNFKLGQTPYEKDILLGTPDVVCGTGDTFATQKPKIDCDIVDMEAYAIAKICKKHKVDFLCYKYISDSADNNASNDWAKNVAKGCKLFKQEVLDNLLQPF